MRVGTVLSRGLIALAVALLFHSDANAAADRQTARLDDSYVFAYPNPCNGETLLLSTDVSTFTRLLVDGNGGTHFHFNGRWQYRAVSGTGVEYVGSETGNRSILMSSGGTHNEVYESQGHLIAKGPGPDLHIHTFMKLTVTPDGTVSNEIVRQTVDCRG
jgi:hypothetical protein